jgi:uncharacterized protein (DUF58 family)
VTDDPNRDQPPPAQDLERGRALEAAAVVWRARRLRFRVRPDAVSALAGAYLGARPGTGLAFSELRPYEPGDDVRHLDWNVTARQGRPYVRKYVEERSLELQLVVDVSASMRFGQPGRAKADRAAQTAALLCSAAIQNQDLCGLILVTDRVEHQIEAAGGTRQLAHILRALVTASSSSRRTDLAAAADRLTSGRRGLAVVISDFISPGKPAVWRRKCRRRRLVAIRIVDPRERALPTGFDMRITDSESGELAFVGGASRRDVEAYARAALARDEAFGGWCREARAEAFELTTDQDPIRPLLGYFRARSHGRLGAR